MKAILQRVTEASVEVDGKEVSKIEDGLLVLLGVGVGDGDEQVDWMVRKIAQLRIFEDENEHMNRSVEDIGGRVILVSQFTLYADCKKGNRPSFVEAASAEEARRLYEQVLEKMRQRLGEEKVGSGVFQTHMDVRLLNSGPVTILLETPEVK